MRAFRNRFLVAGRQDGFSQLWIYDPATGSAMQLTTPEQVRDVNIAANDEYNTNHATIWSSSPVTPDTWYDLDLITGEQTMLLQQAVAGHDPANYTSERLLATAPDGVEIPISLVRRLDAPPGPGPLLLIGYGAYGISTDPWFAPERLSLLDRGVTIALAHVRGGQELGAAWYEDGKLLHKRNTFSDFIACAETLIARGDTTPAKHAANGGSAGGMLMGVVANERPDLFGAIIAKVPFVDVLRTMLDPAQPLTTGKYVEWGDPAAEPFTTSIGGYSPYDNVVAQGYPNLYLTGGMADDTVPYWNAAKWAAQLRATKTDDNLLLLRTEMAAGPQGETGFSGWFRDIAEEYAFLLLTLE